MSAAEAKIPWGSPVFYFYLFSMCGIAKETEISHSRVNGGGRIWWKMIFEKAAESLGAPVPTPRSAAGTDAGRGAGASRRARPGALLPPSLSLPQLPTKPSLPRPSPLRSCTVPPPPCAVPAALSVSISVQHRRGTSALDLEGLEVAMGKTQSSKPFRFHLPLPA